MEQSLQQIEQHLCKIQKARARTPEQPIQTTTGALRTLYDLLHNIGKLSSTSEDRSALDRYVVDINNEIQHWLQNLSSGPPELDPQQLIYNSNDPNSVLGNGAYGAVYRGKLKGTDVAIKVPKPGISFSSSQLDVFRHELQLVRKIFHPNVVLVIGGCTKPVKIVFELMKTSLDDFIEKENVYHYSKRPISARLKIAKDVAKGLAWLHSINIIHRDLKLQNILIDENDTAKVSDFGLSINQDLAHSVARAGNALYRSPEIFKNKPSSAKSDVYSFGILSWEIIEGCLWNPPFNDSTSFSRHILQGNRPQFTSNKFPVSICQLTRLCWGQLPEHRPAMEEVVQTLDHIMFELELEAGIYKSPDAHLGREFWASNFNRWETKVSTEKFLSALRQKTGKEDLTDLKALLCNQWSSSDPTTNVDGFVTLERFNIIQYVFGNFFLKDAVNYDEMSIVKEIWFHGTISRDEAITRLAPFNPGTFLVRIGLNYPFVISCKVNGDVTHLQISRTPENKFDFDDRVFDTVGDCVQHAAQLHYCQTICNRSIEPTARHYIKVIPFK